MSDSNRQGTPDGALTDQWMEVFNEDKAAGTDFAESFWYRLAVKCLPLGVDDRRPDVARALREIRTAIARKGTP